MTSLVQKILEEELMEAANALLPLHTLEQLRFSLDKLDKCLAWVGQPQVKSFQAALDHAGKVLTAKELLNHADVDVRVSVASCINHILRITAPDAPFDDERLKRKSSRFCFHKHGFDYDHDLGRIRWRIC
ncbi:uncharacterized protein LOC110807539 [Carica papaya]|uniref:uncharacterized protein LOC110807539 n=1 Tax=Carica papaya TaxID=3649 RepID=UPI000B8C7A65|nr:uncharacterized protein LOC110807539 [Carica papaya]